MANTPNILPPKGFYRIDEAYDVWFRIRHGHEIEEFSCAKLDAIAMEFIGGLKARSNFISLVTQSGSEHDLPADTWDSKYFPELHLHSPKVVTHGFGPLAAYDGGIICFEKTETGRWAKQDLRNLLIEDLRYGRVTLDYARATAEKEGLENLEGNPDPAKFDPTLKNYWTIVMTVAWIVWRDMKRVLEHSHDYKSKCSVFIWQQWRIGFDGRVHEGWIHTERGGATLLDLMLDEAVYDQGAMSEQAIQSELEKRCTVKESREELWRQLETGKLEATGVQRFSQRQTIAAHLWQDLVIGGDGKSREYLHPKKNLNKSLEWNEVTISRDAVMKLWPAKQEGSVDSAVKKQSNFDAAQMLPNESMRQAEKWSGRANIVSNRPPKQRQAAMDYLSKIEPGRVSDKLESLVSDMASVTGITVSTDTMRRARQKREA